MKVRYIKGHSALKSYADLNQKIMHKQKIKSYFKVREFPYFYYFTREKKIAMATHCWDPLQWLCLYLSSKNKKLLTLRVR